MSDITEYELHTQGACHCLTPVYDGRDPMRNRPHSNGTDTTMTIQRYGLGREYAGNTGSPAITEQADGAYVSHTDHLALINELQAELVRVERIAAAQTVTIAELRSGPVADCWSNNDGDSWSEHPADGDFVDGLKVGDEYELQASVSSWPERFRVIKAPDDTSDDYEVEPVSIRTASKPPASAQPAASAAPDCSHCGGFGSVTGDHPDIECSVCNGSGKATPTSPADGRAQRENNQ